MGLPRIGAEGRRWILLRLIFNGLGQALLAVGMSLLVKHGFEQMVVGGGGIASTGTAMVAAALVAAWLIRQEHVDAERLGQDFVHQVRKVMFRQLVALDIRQLQRRSRGAILLRFVGDLTALRQWISQGIARLLVSGLCLLLALVALAVIDPVMGGAVGGTVLAAGALSLLLGARLRRSTRRARRQRARLAGLISERLSRLMVIQAFGQSRRERRRIERRSERLREAMLERAAVTGWLRALTEGSSTLATACTLFVGALSVSGGRTTAGSVVAAMVVAGLLAPRLKTLGRVYEYWTAATVARQKLERFLAMPCRSDPADAPPLARGPGAIELREVGLEGAIQNVTVQARPGERVALVGPNGAGKSTLLALVAGLIRADSGSVLLDGQALEECRERSVRRAFALVGPDLPLLRGSLEMNLRYGNQRAGDRQRARVMALCGLDRLVEELPQGLQTRLTEGGENLSAGQRARLSLARALLHRPRVLLLDEADANLDPQACGILERVLETFPGTVLMVTHDLRRLRQADRVWYLAEGGRLAETGSPADLLAGDGPTARLFHQELKEVA